MLNQFTSVIGGYFFIMNGSSGLLPAETVLFRPFNDGGERDLLVGVFL
jgi:hypothetical protein